MFVLKKGDFHKWPEVAVLWAMKSWIWSIQNLYDSWPSGKICWDNQLTGGTLSKTSWSPVVLSMGLPLHWFEMAPWYHVAVWYHVINGMCYDREPPRNAMICFSRVFCVSLRLESAACFALVMEKKILSPCSNSDIWDVFLCTFQGCQFRNLWLTVGESLGHLICFMCWKVVICFTVFFVVAIDIIDSFWCNFFMVQRCPKKTKHTCWFSLRSRSMNLWTLFDMLMMWMW